MIARTIVLNFGHNEAKQIFARVGKAAGAGETSRIIMTLCMVKTMMGWHAEHVSRICRERTGGAGYLWCNVIGDVMIGAHSAATAEGDNKVLM